MFEILEHTADIGFRARARTEEALFANAATALVSIATELDEVLPQHVYPLAASGEDRESLLVNWLSEVLYQLDANGVLFRRFQVEKIAEDHVTGKGYGEPRDPERHHAKLVVKGVTYHQLKIEQDAGGWIAEVYLDV